jgi:non-ribosomal peptide synthase protein (TIGR01720 family)
VNDVLLASLGLAVCDWRRRKGLGTATSVLIDLEAHGRDGPAHIDLTRTVGWFTSVFPVRLDFAGIDVDEALHGGRSLGQAVKLVREQMRALPDGLSYGLLRYVNRDTAPALASCRVPQIGFNYMGRFATGAARNWAPAVGAAVIGGAVDPDSPLAHTLEVNAVTHDRPDGPELLVYWTWAGALLDETSVGDLSQTWFRVLEAMTVHAHDPQAGGLSPSDVPLVGLSQAEIERLESLYAPPD